MTFIVHLLVLNQIIDKTLQKKNNHFYLSIGYLLHYTEHCVGTQLHISVFDSFAVINKTTIICEAKDYF
jgi:hypothetical protein